MNLLTLLGAAAACKEFCELLFDNPVEAAGLLNITLTQGELAQLKKTFNSKDRSTLCGHLSRVSTMVCRKPPCPYAPVVPGRKDFCKPAA